MELTQTQKIILSVIRESSLHKKFYWTGGTLLAYRYLKHRYSADLDFFSENQFVYDDLIPFLSLLKKKLRIGKLSENKIDGRWEFIIPREKSTRIDFVYYNHDKKRLKALEHFEGILADSLDDIAANKVMAYFDRNEPKDLFDIYYLLTKAKYRVPHLLKMVEKKFGANFSEFMFWSESAKSLKLLSSLKPFFTVSGKRNQDQLIDEIATFFLQNSSDFLRTKIK